MVNLPTSFRYVVPEVRLRAPFIRRCQRNVAFIFSKYHWDCNLYPSSRERRHLHNLMILRYINSNKLKKILVRIPKPIGMYYKTSCVNLTFLMKALVLHLRYSTKKWRISKLCRIETKLNILGCFVFCDVRQMVGTSLFLVDSSEGASKGPNVFSFDGSLINVDNFNWEFRTCHIS